MTVPMTPLEDSILRTLLYADVFNFPMTLAEIQHFLIAPAPTTEASIERVLAQSERLRELVTCVNGYFMLIGRESLAEVRETRERASQALWADAQRYGHWLGRLPFVRMVALTGALAVHNAVEDDDIDYVLVTRVGRVWLARALAIVVVRQARLRGVQLCPNYVLSEAALAQDLRSLYMAHEIVQMIPLVGLGVYQRMRHENAWVSGQLPNALEPLYRQVIGEDGVFWRRLKQFGEGLLGGAVGDRLEAWERERKLRRFAERAQGSQSARLDAQHVKGHFSDHGQPTMARYAARLQEYGISADL
jgi:hypothetical protein